MILTLFTQGRLRREDYAGKTAQGKTMQRDHAEEDDV